MISVGQVVLSLRPSPHNQCSLALNPPLHTGTFKVGCTRVEPTLHLSHGHRKVGSPQFRQVGSIHFCKSVRPTCKAGLTWENMAERGRLWSEGEISTLLDAWSEGRIQAQLLGAVRSEVPFRKNEEELRKPGYDCSYKQCRNKIKALKKRYKDTVDRQRRSGAGCESDNEDVTVQNNNNYTM